MSSIIAPVLVTGATGNVGRHVASALRGLGVPFVAGGTDAGRPLTPPTDGNPSDRTWRGADGGGARPPRRRDPP